MSVFTKVAGLSTAFALGIVSLPASAQTTNWTGFYFGGNLGLGAGHNTSQDTTTLNPPGGTPGVINPIASTLYYQTPIDLLAGGQVGYNYQSGLWVFGAEADFDWTSQRSVSWSDSFLASTTVVSPSRQSLYTDQTLKWLSTWRARAGRADGSWLWYLTGGMAVAQIDSSYGFSANNATGNTFNTPGNAAMNASAVKIGWTFGGGVETSLASFNLPKWSAKLEYMYVDLGNISNTLNAQAPNITAGYAVTSSSDIRDHVIRVGLNYRFGAPGPLESEAPPAAATPQRSWTGFYIGGNAGGSLGLNPTTDVTTFSPAGSTGGTPPGINNPMTNASFNHSPSGLLGGGQLGYSMQFGNWLVGVEGDWDYANQTSVVTKQVFTASSTTVAPTLLGYSDEQHIRWIATTRARFGRVEDNWMWFLTGGLAFAQIDSTYNLSANSTFATLNGLFPGSMTTGGVQAGWTIGGGMETSLAGLGLANWTGKLEYLYVNLGNISNTMLVPSGGGQGYMFTSSSAINIHMARLGINYHF
ncbi:MAG TPA: outer membrane beta-barrel protein [Reyranella sp.]|nr:outer membrane beta-barrel protein [Reyranella sp.]